MPRGGKRVRLTRPEQEQHDQELQKRRAKNRLAAQRYRARQRAKQDG